MGRRMTGKWKLLLAAGMVSLAMTSSAQASSAQTTEAQASSAQTPAIQTTLAQESDTQASSVQTSSTQIQSTQTPEAQAGASLAVAPLTTYEIFTGSFADSNGDGIGDLNGIREHLDYINDGDPSTEDNLGVDAIWLTPIFPSPTYHKYDASDYENIDPDFGTLEDFDELLDDCHARDVRLFLDLAVNHTSTEHPWFVAAADCLRELSGNSVTPIATEVDDGSSDAKTTAETEQGDLTAEREFAAAILAQAKEQCPYVDYYNFSTKAQDGYAQLDGTDFYYEARFWSGMPDLNLDSEAVRNEISDITKFWLNRGVDGFRLDAVTSYYTEDKQKSIEFLAWLTDTVKSIKSDAYLVGECWADQATIADYAESGIDSLFDFPFAGQDGTIAQTVRSGSGAAKWAQALENTESLYSSVNADFIDAPFYTNHDMARSAGYYSYDDGTKAKLAGGMNLLMSGNAFVYYGEEVGLKGSGKDENKRAPMPWAEEDSAVTAGPPDMDKIDLKYGTVQEQASDSDSILSYFRQAIRLREDYPVIATGQTHVLDSLSTSQVAVFLKGADGDESNATLVVVNVGDSKAEIDLSADNAADGFRTLAASLNAQTEESARKAAQEAASGTGSSGNGHRGRRSRQASASTETEGESTVGESEEQISSADSADSDGTTLTLTSSLDGDHLTVPAYGIAVLTQG